MEIALYDKVQDPLAAVRGFGEFFARSGMFGCDKLEQGQVLAMACLAERKSPFEIKRTYHLMNGELSMRADAMLAELRKRGGKHRVIERSAELCTIEVTYDGETIRTSFSHEEAKAEPFYYQKDGKTPKKNWATPRARMQVLWARVVSDSVRTICPEIVAGTYAPEELDDTQSAAVPVEIKITPQPAKTEPAKPKPAPVVEVEVVAEPVPEAKADEKAEAAAGVAPAQPAGEDRPTLDEFNRLGAFMDEAPDRFDLAMAWMKAQNPPWLLDRQGFANLTGTRVRRILNQKASFLRAIGGGK